MEYEDAGLFLVCMDVVEGRQRKVASLRGDVVEGRQRKVASLRAGTPSGDILLGLRETAKSIAAGSELASGSDSRSCRNNAVSRSPSSNHPSSAAARPDATFLWLTLPADRKKHAGDGSGLGVLS